MSHFNVSLTVWAKSQDSVHKPQVLKRKESRSGSNRGPSAYQPSSSPLGRTGSPSLVPILQRSSRLKEREHADPFLSSRGGLSAAGDKSVIFLSVCIYNTFFLERLWLPTGL